MRAADAEGGRITVREVPSPEPGPGEALLRVLACGVCGSDLHHFAGRAVDAAPLVYGHEFAAEVLAYGPGTSGPPAGTRVCAVPQAGGEIVGLSERHPGGFAERVVVAADMLHPIPAHVPSDHASLTEPLAVGGHAVAAANLHPTDVALVLGCGPIGLSVIAALKSAPGPGVPVIAADLSPARRALARRMGADEVVDPVGGDDPSARLGAHGVALAPSGASLRGGVDGPGAVVFECVGVPGMLGEVFAGAPPHARVVVAGACMEPDTVLPVLGIVKELRLSFVFGYTRAEFAGALAAIASGAVDPAPMITGTFTLDGVAGAFTALADPERHAKILVHPSEDAPAPGDEHAAGAGHAGHPRRQDGAGVRRPRQGAAVRPLRGPDVAVARPQGVARPLRGQGEAAGRSRDAAGVPGNVAGWVGRAVGPLGTWAGRGVEEAG